MISFATIWPGALLSARNYTSHCRRNTKLTNLRTSKRKCSASSTTWEHPESKTIYTLTLSQSTKTNEADLDACFSLVEETSRKDYEASSRGWNPQAKKEEMREPDLRYILVKDPAGNVCAYTSLMPTMEDGEPVLYCYEIHLKPELRGTGLAALLMDFLETVATNIKIMDKVMLTVFTCNHRAMAFYRRCGFDVDETSPQPRKLRNGVVKELDYAIMSKTIDRRHSVLAQTGQGSVAKGSIREGSGSRLAKMAKLDQSKTSQNQSRISKDLPEDI